MISLENLFEESIFTDKNSIESINSTENLNNIQSSERKIEQNSIKLEYSIEADNESEGDFESAAGDSDSNNSNNDVNSDNEDTDFGGSDNMPSFDDESGPSDATDDNFDDSDDGAASDNDKTGNNETDTGMDEIDKKTGSSLNPFTQVNQKMYLMDQMNLLYTSISNAIEKYTITYSETVELQQLRELLDIVGNERDSFIMQENPENMIKYELYMKQYELIIKNLTNKIKEYE